MWPQMGNSAGDDVSLALVGGLTRIKNSIIVVGTTAQELIKQNPDRVALIIAASTGATYHISPSEDLNGTNNYTLVGPSVASFSYRDFLVLPGARWSAICSVAGGQLHVIEVIRYKRA